jgi:hypothetical protein
MMISQSSAVAIVPKGHPKIAPRFSVGRSAPFISSPAGTAEQVLLIPTNTAHTENSKRKLTPRYPKLTVDLGLEPLIGGKNTLFNRLFPIQEHSICPITTRPWNISNQSKTKTRQFFHQSCPGLIYRHPGQRGSRPVKLSQAESRPVKRFLKTIFLSDLKTENLNLKTCSGFGTLVNPTETYRTLQNAPRGSTP